MCANPGTMCARVASSGSHGMFNLHVCVDFIVSPSGRLMINGFVVGLTSITGAPGTMKCPVAPASAIAWSTAILIELVLKIVSACSVSFSLSNSITFFHAFSLVGSDVFTSFLLITSLCVELF